jgi:hypothetical protein
MNSRIEVLERRPADRLRRPPPRWAVVTAWAAFACTVPSAVWRVLMVEGLVPGTAALRTAHAGDHAYVWGLSLVQVTAGLLTIGLVRTWGERLAGRAVPRWVPIGVGAAGGLAVTWIFTVTMTGQVLGGARPDQGLVHGSALALMVACYAPILAWGPLELATVASYAARHPREDR